MNIKDLFNARVEELKNTSFFNQISDEIKPYGYALESCYSYVENDTTFLEFNTGNNNKYFDIVAYTMDDAGVAHFGIAQSHFSYMNNWETIRGTEQITAMKNAIKVVEILESKDWRLCPSLDKSTLIIAEGVTEIEAIYPSYSSNNELSLDTLSFNSNLSCLESISFPSSMKVINADSFKDCINLKEVTMDVGTYYASFMEDFGWGSKSRFPDTFSNCPKLSTLRIRGSKRDLCSLLFEGISAVYNSPYWRVTPMVFSCNDGEFSYGELLKEVQHKEEMKLRKESTEEPMRALKAYLNGCPLFWEDCCREKHFVEEGHLFNWNPFWRWGHEEYKIAYGFNKLSSSEKSRIEALLDIMEYYINGGDIEEKRKPYIEPNGTNGTLKTPNWEKVDSKTHVWNIENYDYRKC